MIKLHEVSPQVYFVVAAEARRRGILFGGHIGRYFERPEGISAMDASDSGAVILDHVGLGQPGVSRDLDSLCLGKVATVTSCQPIADRLRRNGTWSVPTMMVDGFYRRLRPRVQFIFDHFTERTQAFLAGSPLGGNWLRDSTLAEPALESADSLHRFSVAQQVGLPLLAGTDAAPAWTIPWTIRKLTPGFSLRAELACFVAEGLTPLAALQAATLNPAKFLHATDSLGTVAPGRLADLVLLNADPLADITNTTTISAVVANGRYYDRAALDSLLAEVRTKAQLGKEEP